MNKPTNYLLSLVAFLVTLNLAAQTNQDTRALQSFNSVKISNSIEAELVKGDRNELEISASGIELDRISSKINQQVLDVKITGSNFGATSVKVKITYIDISEVSASTAAKVFVKDTLGGKMVKINATTSSYVEAEVDAQNLLVEAATNAKIFVNGHAGTLDLKAFTNAEINGTNLEVDEAKVRVNTAASANFTVNQSIEGSAATAGKVLYRGEPNMVDVRTNTGGAIESDL